MRKDFEDAKISLHNIEQLKDIKTNPLVKCFSVYKHIPFVGDLIDGTIDSVLNNFQQKKRNELIEIILSDNEIITTEMMNDVEFIINFARTFEAIDRLATNDKVKYFGNLIKNGYFTEDKIQNNEFEEYRQLLQELSYREIYILISYNKKAEQYYHKHNHFDNFLEDNSYISMVKSIQKKFNIDTSVVEDILLRLQNKGLCIYNEGNSYSEGSSTLMFETPYYKQLKKRIVSDS